MANTVTVGFSNDGQRTHYVVDNIALAAAMDVDSENILGSTAITDNVTSGAFEDTYYIPATEFAKGGSVDAYYGRLPNYETYIFTATGWNQVKNITVKASGSDRIYLYADNFVHADLDFSGVTNRAHLILYDGKRGNILSGSGNDSIFITTATNVNVWSNEFRIHTGSGNDNVTIAVGDKSLIGTTIVNHVDGRYTTVIADLGDGNDVFRADDNNTFFIMSSRDTIDGGAGNDAIVTGRGNDVIRGGTGMDALEAGEDTGSALYESDGVYKLVSWGDEISGGADADVFLYNTANSLQGSKGDGFDRILDFQNEDRLQIILNDGLDASSIEFETVTLKNGATNLSGTMVTVNDKAAVFLENFFNQAEILV